MKKTIRDREADFIKLCEPYFEEYGKPMVKNFIEYWTEININGKKMRFEKENTFGLKRRLSTWKRNDEKWNFKKKKEKLTGAQAFRSQIK